MRILRIRLQNWRGVGDREVRFAPTGVTVVAGPNEAGKTSLVEALDLLFDELDSSSKARVRAVQPVHADVGSAVEADFETGPYSATYTKQFHRRAGTTLVVHAPRPESHRGREAHARAEAILAETLDVALWKALRVAQGEGLDQAAVSADGWLGAALERAAGGTARGGEREETLFEAVCAERDRWWTEAWKPRKELADAEQRLAAAAAEEARLRAEVERVEQDVERAARLARDVARLDAAARDAAARAAERDADVARVAGLRAARDDAEVRQAQADAARTRADAARDERRRLAAEADEAFRAAETAEASAGADAPAADAARSALAEAEAALAAAESRAAESARDADRAERDFEFRREELDLQMLGERRARLEAADRAAAEAEAVVARVRIDDASLVKLRALRDDFVRAEARLDAAGAAVRIEAVAACAPEIDGNAAPLAAGDVRDVRVTGSLRVELPGSLRIDVRAGAAAEAPRAEFDRRRRALEEALAAAGAASLDEAVAANAALRDARRVLADRDRVAADELRDLTREAFLHKIASLGPRVAAYRAQRGGDPPLPPDFGAAQDVRRLAKDAAAAAAAALADARAACDAARRRAETATTRSRTGEVEARLRRERAREARDVHARAVAQVPDDALDRAAEAAAAAWRDATTAADAARGALAAAQPDVVEDRARGLRDALRRAQEDLRRGERELDALRAELTVRGDEGLSARHGAADAELDAARGDAARKRTQAGAARALFEAMSAERSAERSRYVEPFRAKVEALGRVVFGEDLAVSVTPGLRIESRTLGGRTVPFESLSGGAREQLGVVSRLACAMLAAEQGGVPVVLDDSFGWSDPDRLERMGALLAHAGRTCQVILLTCDPARARGIPGAEVVRVG